jgi:hypothetical protein
MKISFVLINLILIFNLLASGANCETPHFFKPKTHKEINNKMLEKVLGELNVTLDKKKTKICQSRLNSTQKFQDYFVLALAKAHFDNCAFQKSINYINRLMKQNEKFAEEYTREFARGEEQKELDLLRRKIMVNKGKILHASMDFYAHSNFIELMQSEYPDLSDVPLIKVWEENGQKQILGLQQNNNLISGTAWWVFPKKCSKKSPSHGKLAKDSSKYEAGKKTTIWKDTETEKNMNGFEAAHFFAEESTYQFLLHTFNKYPMLKDYCGTINP